MIGLEIPGTNGMYGEDAIVQVGFDDGLSVWHCLAGVLALTITFIICAYTALVITTNQKGMYKWNGSRSMRRNGLFDAIEEGSIERIYCQGCQSSDTEKAVDGKCECRWYAYA